MAAGTRSLRTDLRYLLVLHIHRHGLTTVSELVTMLADIGFDLDGRPSKTVSDTLRTDVKLDRVRRRGRGLYSPGRCREAPNTVCAPEPTSGRG